MCTQPFKNLTARILKGISHGQKWGNKPSKLKRSTRDVSAKI